MSPYKISLGSKFLRRARIIFATLTFSFVIFFIAGTYSVIQSGEFEKNILSPIKQFGNDLKTALDNPLGATGGLSLQYEPVYIASPSPTTTPSKPKTQKTQTTTTQYTKTTTTSDDSYQKAKAEQDAWWAKVQAQNQALSQQSKKELEEFRAQSAKNMEEFKLKSQTDFDKFSQEGQAQMEEFKKKYGIK